ncbi:peptidylprolyl isomerase [Denitratisoma oestradiolicum]|uniref:peptidylprolyl isomerase n=1 Tax=Denitratisoma oestradiolicum TaxID=311182 RepID=A0A6S6YL79_9PROT|nr:peptidylprolyl isomerase [Denitratisoma oestradiolicum]TWO81300.1 peptidylprolyl isomerase [Denitratisoma oestradiolicum]CAB1368484.1 putative parvulin-type peptidyl-prolyl cis-trans isomerase [Denitratisoma oestradiolicum]
MKHPLLKASLISLAASLSASALAATPAKTTAPKADIAAVAPYVTVNGKAVPKHRADFLLAIQKAQGRPESEELRQAVREEVIRREILAQEALKKGVDKRSEIIGQINLAAQGVLINAYISDYLRANPISDEAVSREYDAIKAQLGDTEYRVRHILVESEDQAKEIIAKLKQGEKFEALAQQSKDPGSKEKGGELGWSIPSNYVKPFADAIIKLENGKVTETPVKSDFGWHVIELEETRALKLPAMDETKPQIIQRLQQQVVERHIGELRAKAKID